MKKETVYLVEEKLRAYPGMKRHPRSGVDEAWCAVIDEMLAELREDGQGNRERMVELRYFVGQSERAVQAALPVGRNSFRTWRAEVIATVAAKAAYKKLLKP